MAHNEMKAKPALPERVRSMEGLGVGCGEEHLPMPDRREDRTQTETDACVFIALDFA